MRRSNRNVNIPPRANLRHLTALFARGVGTVCGRFEMICGGGGGGVTPESLNAINTYLAVMEDFKGRDMQLAK